MISDAQHAEIRRLFYGEHWKVGTIATELGLHRDTVARAVGTEHFTNTGKSRPSALDPYVEFIQTTLTQYPRLTATRVFEMVRGRGYEGSVVQLRRRIRQLDLRPKPRSEAFFRLTVLPGEQAQVDWGYFGKVRVGGTERKLWLFVMVLSWSRAHHVYFSFDQSAAAVLRGHVEAFETFGGVPRTILYDNMKTVVIERVGDAIRFHPRLLDLASHYLFAAYPCNPRRANEKGRVEVRIRDLRNSFFAARRFTDLDDLRRQFVQWRDDVAYARRCPSDRDRSVAEALSHERSTLMALPVNRLSTDDVRAVVARKQPYVNYDTNLYSVPHDLVGEALTLAVSDREVRVLHGDALVAHHVRSWDRHVVVEDPEHLQGLADSKHKARALHGRQRLLAEVPEAEPLLQVLAQRQEPLGPQTAALLVLLERYERADLARAIEEALERGTPRAASVAHLLEQRMRERGLAPTPPVRVSDRDDIQNLTVTHHSLEDYDDLALG